MQFSGTSTGTGNFGGDPPDRKPTRSTPPAPTEEFGSITLAATVVSFIRGILHFFFGSNMIETASNVPRGAAAGTSRVLTPSVRYYAVFVGREVGVMESW